MTATNEAFTSKGGIETAMGARNQAIAAAHHAAPPAFHIENPERYREAMKARLLFVGEPSVRCDTFGNVFYETVVPGMRPENQGKLFKRWHKRSSIFTVRDDVVGIIEDYEPDGIQYLHRTSAVKAVNRVDMRLQEGPLSESERDELRVSSINDMVNAGYTSSVYPERVKTATQLVKATELDILGRPNNPRGRMIAESRRPQLINDGLVADDILKKNRRRLSVIEAVCDLVEQDFENVARFSADTAGAKIGTGGFGTEFIGYRNIVHRILSPKSSPLPKPYAELAAKIRYMLWARSFETDVVTLGKYMDFKEAIEFSDKYPCLERAADSATRRDRVRAVAAEINEGIEKIREQRAVVSTEQEEQFAMPDEVKKQSELAVDPNETPNQRRSRLSREREWRWIERNAPMDGVYNEVPGHIDES